MNLAVLIGNVGQDPEVKYLDNGKPVASFSLATSKSWTDKKGDKQTKTEWHNIVAWDKRAQMCEKFLHKGMKVAIQGEIETRTWEDKNGVKKSRTEIIASEITFLVWPAQGAPTGTHTPTIPDEAPPVPEAPVDDLPF